MRCFCICPLRLLETPGPRACDTAEGLRLFRKFLCCKYDFFPEFSYLNHYSHSTKLPPEGLLWDQNILLSRSIRPQLSGSRERSFTMAWSQHVTWRVPHSTQDLPFKLVLSSNATSGHVSRVYPTAQTHVAHFFREEIYLNSNMYGFNFQQAHSMWTWGWAAGW